MSTVTPASCTDVSPAAAAAARPFASRRLRTSRVGGGTFEATSPCAVSTKTPAGAPDASRMMRPPEGSAVAAVRPAIASARVLAQPAWPSTRTRYTGRSRRGRGRARPRWGTASRASRSGPSRAPAATRPAAACCARAATRSSASCRLAAPTRSRLSAAWPMPSTCTCASDSPGTTLAARQVDHARLRAAGRRARPRRRRPRRCARRARPPRVARGRASSSVITVPPREHEVGGPLGGRRRSRPGTAGRRESS